MDWYLSISENVVTCLTSKKFTGLQNNNEKHPVSNSSAGKTTLRSEENCQTGLNRPEGHSLQLWWIEKNFYFNPNFKAVRDLDLIFFVFVYLLRQNYIIDHFRSIQGLSSVSGIDATQKTRYISKHKI